MPESMQSGIARGGLAEPPLPLRLKLSALWASLTFCYLYGDYFGLYKPGKLQHMLDGAGPMGPASQGSLLFVALLLVVPGLMVAMSAPSVCPSGSTCGRALSLSHVIARSAPAVRNASAQP